MLHLPKVAEKKDYEEFMINCVVSNQMNNEEKNKQLLLINNIINNDEYIVFVHEFYELQIVTLVTNKGKIFKKNAKFLG